MIVSVTSVEADLLEQFTETYTHTSGESVAPRSYQRRVTSLTSVVWCRVVHRHCRSVHTVSSSQNPRWLAMHRIQTFQSRNRIQQH